MTIPESLPSGFSTPEGRPIRILFVCLGNICRSPAAEEVFRTVVEEHHCSSGFEIDSAGMGRYHIGSLPDQRMRVHARRRGLDLTHRCRCVTDDDFDNFDLIIGMDSMNISDLRDMAPTVESQHKIVPMASFFGSFSHYDHVPDPYYQGSEGFELVLDLLQDACVNLFDTLSHNSGHPAS